jgi:hypothetical protein
MASNMTTELKKAGVHEEIIRFMRDHSAEIERMPVEFFNVDDAFRFVLNTTISLKECLEAISTTVKTAEGCFRETKAYSTSKRRIQRRKTAILHVDSSPQPEIETGATLSAQLMDHFGADNLATMVRLGNHTSCATTVAAREPVPESEPEAEANEAELTAQHPEQSSGSGSEQLAAAFDNDVMQRCEGAKAELVRRATTVVEAVRVWKDVLRKPDRTRSSSSNGGCAPSACLAVNLMFNLWSLCMGPQGA